MFVLRKSHLRVLLFALLVPLCVLCSTEASPVSTSRENKNCSLPLTVLDFIHNFTQPNSEIRWPCEVRHYWLSLQPFVKLVRFLIGYVTPIIIIVGVLLNSASFALLSTPVLSDSNLSLYLRILAISDNGALVFNYAVGIMKSHFTAVNNLFMNSRFLCSLNSVSMEFFQFTSTWLVVALTWARVLGIMFPFGFPGSCRNCSTLIIIATLTCLSLIISLTKLYSGGYETDSIFEFIPCQKKIKPWGSAMYFYIALSTWLPLLFTFIGNVLLIKHMRKSERIHCQLTKNFRQQPNRMHHISRTLFAVSTVYLILLLPLGIVETLELYWDVILVKSPPTDGADNTEYINWLKEKMFLKWCRGFFFHVYHWNFAINFMLYYLTGEKFRSIVLQTLKRYKAAISAICLRHISKRVIRAKCSNDSATARPSNMSPIHTITLMEHTINPSSPTQNQSNIVNDQT